MLYKKRDNLIVQDVEFNTTEDLKVFIADVMRFMGDRKDSEIETAEAVNKAITSGFCIEVLNEDSRIGVLIINRGVFDKFQPKYHLAYIAISEHFHGEGIGRLLLEIACEVTENSIALHVGLDNKNAIAFYKKLGWEETYIRMMPDNWKT